MTGSLTALSHTLRFSVNDEVHARPSDKVMTPRSVTYIANLFRSMSDTASEHARLTELLRSADQPDPPRQTKHLIATVNGLRVRYERHTEFSRYAIINLRSAVAPFSTRPLHGIPDAWLETLAGDIFVAVQLCVAPMPGGGIDIDAIGAEYFEGNTLVGSTVAGGRGIGLTDFRIRDDGFSRILLLNDGMPDSQTGRYVQRLLEIETYRMLALLALPVAQDLLPKLNSSELELAAINKALIDAPTEEEGELLERLTVLASENQGRLAASDFRFSAANAYYALVLQRTEELREVRIPGTQTFSEFTNRRLTPAIKTCSAVATRQQSLVARMSRSTQLLSTRVDVERQKQNQSILESVNRRMRSQLRLQTTVESISVAAVTYYVVGLIKIIGEGFAERGFPVDTTILTAIAVPVVAALMFYSVRRIRRHIDVEET